MGVHELPARIFAITHRLHLWLTAQANIIVIKDKGKEEKLGFYEFVYTLYKVRSDEEWEWKCWRGIILKNHLEFVFVEMHSMIWRFDGVNGIGKKGFLFIYYDSRLREWCALCIWNAACIMMAWKLFVRYFYEFMIFIAPFCQISKRQW